MKQKLRLRRCQASKSGEVSGPRLMLSYGLATIFAGFFQVLLCKGSFVGADSFGRTGGQPYTIWHPKGSSAYLRSQKWIHCESDPLFSSIGAARIRLYITSSRRWGGNKYNPRAHNKEFSTWKCSGIDDGHDHSKSCTRDSSMNLPRSLVCRIPTTSFQRLASGCMYSSSRMCRVTDKVHSKPFIFATPRR